ncbi:MAG: 7-carboxy-7-deazaguanine synthase QueE [Chromatiales bacterium]|jgi:7-carboxy-7-deazaguanine synthase
MVSLRITEIFCSLQGESSLVGLPTVFVRLTGCPLRCSYCDTSYAFKGGETRALDSILDEVAAFGTEHVTVTGGEPLAQRDCLELLVALCDAGYRVSLETSGALDIADVDDRVKRVMDIKTPSSGEVDRNLWSNLELLTSDDEVKFVIADRDDYDWSKALLLEHALLSRCCVLFSPVYEALEARKLADWIVADRLPVRFQIQLHKLLWGDRPGV